MAPVGREFGSPDYESLTALDLAALAAFQSWEQVRDWLATPNSQLDGICPEDAARNPDGLSKVMSILMLAGGHAPDGHPKLLHCWPVKLLQAGRGDYAGSEVMIRRAAASLSL